MIHHTRGSSLRLGPTCDSKVVDELFGMLRVADVNGSTTVMSLDAIEKQHDGSLGVFRKTHGGDDFTIRQGNVTSNVGIVFASRKC